MNQRSLHLLTLLTLACPAVALDSSVWTGLKVVAEVLPAETLINGLPVSAIRFTGKDVLEIEQRWLSMSRLSEVRTVSHHDWRMHTMLNPTVSEVLQVREVGPPELIWSSLSLSAKPATAGRSMEWLPSDCETGRSVEGPRGADHFLQFSAMCQGTAKTLIRTLSARLKRRGYSVLEVSPNGMQAASKKSHLAISFLPPAGRTGVPQTLVAVLERDLPEAFR